jgi:hypothetical protein
MVASNGVPDMVNCVVGRDASGLFTSRTVTECQVIIPVETLGGMSAEEIGTLVLSFVNDARSCLALEKASWVVSEKKKIFRKWQDYAKEVESVKALLTEFKDYGRHDEDPRSQGEINYALTIIEEFEAHASRKGLAKVSKRYERSSASKDFDALFVAVGRRDGFKCAACGSPDNLQLDHIEPVGLGGVTHPDNLQLLCRPCNLRKGERTIDYRGTLQAEGEQ